jgi:DNA-directed RNA polymerase II subunit RPB1
MSSESKYYSEEIKIITELVFNIFRNKEIKDYSAVSSDPFGINLSESYENYEPKKGGLVDLRMGTCDPYLNCTTCGLNYLDCPGHFGHIELAEPVFHYGFLDHLKSLLQCVCTKCSNILIEKSDAHFKKTMLKRSEARFKEIRNLTKNISFCWNCGTPVPKIRKEINASKISISLILEREVGSQLQDDKTGEIIEGTKKILEVLTPRDCYNILRNVSDIDCTLLGFNPKSARPEDLIISRFPVPPVIIRPTSKIDFLASSTMEDSLTLKISDIVTSNQRLRAQLDKETIENDIQNYSNTAHALLQYQVATFFDNESISLPRSEFKTGNPTKSISDRIKGKAGRVRSNLMGKRVDFSGRSVITPDPYINIDQLGVPKKIAMELTIPEEVTPFNIKYLTGLVKNGRDIYPGANFVLRVNYRDGKTEVQKIDLKYRKKAIRLNIGDVVERHSINGDYVLFNRQPTLHKPSMMAHQIHVLDREDANTFRVNVSACKPYGADFDGDEMNIHLAQSIQARNELKRIANVKYQIIGVKDSKPIIGCQQDALSGAFLLTQKNIKIKGSDAANILCNTSSETKEKLEMDKEYSGQEVFTHIIPDGINILKKNDKGEITFQIRDGNLLTGLLDKTSLATEKNSIIHFIWDKYGPNKTRRFIDDVQKLVLNFLMQRGMSISFKDAFLESTFSEQIKKVLDNAVLENKYILTQYENEEDQISPLIIEASLYAQMNAIGSDVGATLKKNLNVENYFWALVTSGAKGSETNLQQMMGCIGQQAIEGRRINKKVEGRSLVYFHKDDDTPEARGFTRSSLLDGLKGYEAFIFTAAGREGLIDTAIKTAQTGYLQRKLIKGLEDLSIKYDGTNRNSRGVIIQYVYGENGINQSSQTEIKLNIMDMDNNKIDSVFAFTDDQIKKLEKKHKISTKDLKKFNEKYTGRMKKYRDEMRSIQQKALMNFKTMEEKFMVPVNLFRITQDYSAKGENLELTPMEVLDTIEEFLNSPETKLLPGASKGNKRLIEDDKSLKFILEIALHEYLSPNKCIFEYGLSKNKLKDIWKEITLSFVKSMAEPGEMVGILAAQSIGEPTTQLNLNTKHFAGVASKSGAASGVPRLVELLSFSKDIKTPQIIVYFEDSIRSDKNAVNKIASYFKYLSIGQLIDSAKIYYDVGTEKSLSVDNVSTPFFVNNQKAELSSLPFVFRIKMNLEKMLDKETTLLDIKTKFISYWYKNYTNTKTMKKNEKDVFSKISRCAILSNTTADKEQIIHIRFSMSSFNYQILVDFLNIVLENITLKGIDGIEDINMEEQRVLNFNKETGASQVEKEFVVTTNGINLEKIKYMKGVNLSRVILNDIFTIYRNYGIEATRQILMIEYYKVLGDKLNSTHLSLLVDMMTHNGETTSIDRHGLSKLESDPCARASFEQTMDHFINAAIFNEKDTMKSVSSNVMLGKVIPGGTGAFDLMIDTNKLENSEYTSDETGGRITFAPLEEDSILKDVLKYGINQANFFIPATA